MSDHNKELMTEMFKTIERLDTNIDIIKTDIGEQKVILAKQEANIGEHMRRSDAIEKHVEILEAAVTVVKTKINYVEGALKLLGVIGIVIGIAGGLLKIWLSFFH